MPDMFLTCVQCENGFPWTEDEQGFYAQMGFTQPRRCPACRPDRQRSRSDNRQSIRGWVPPAQDGKYFDSSRIVQFVQSVEDTKGFQRDVRLVFSHLVEEIGELSAAIWKYEKDGLASYVGKELIDIIFLSLYLADILHIDLNRLTPERMAEIRRQYGVPA